MCIGVPWGKCDWHTLLCRVPGWWHYMLQNVRDLEHKHLPAVTAHRTHEDEIFTVGGKSHESIGKSSQHWQADLVGIPGPRMQHQPSTPRHPWEDLISSVFWMRWICDNGTDNSWCWTFPVGVGRYNYTHCLEDISNRLRGFRRDSHHEASGSPHRPDSIKESDVSFRTVVCSRPTEAGAPRLTQINNQYALQYEAESSFLQHDIMKTEDILLISKSPDSRWQCYMQVQARDAIGDYRSQSKSQSRWKP